MNARGKLRSEGERRLLAAATRESDNGFEDRSGWIEVNPVFTMMRLKNTAGAKEAKTIMTAPHLL